jgi:hypothetical protein
MRLKAAQAVLLVNREASQAERRRFEPGHPLHVKRDRMTANSQNWCALDFEIALVEIALFLEQSAL